MTLPKYYRFCLWLTVVECAVAFTVALAQWVNLIPLWITMPDADNLTQFEKYVVSGYGFWASVWAVPNYVMLRSRDLSTVRLWAKLAGFVYLIWWIIWWEELWNGTWQWYAMIFYIPARVFQLGANFYYGYRKADA